MIINVIIILILHYAKIVISVAWLTAAAAAASGWPADACLLFCF